MSSAILYLAIVAIWACVLIPRWLRRDSAHGATVTVSEITVTETFGPPAFGPPAFGPPAFEAPVEADADEFAADELPLGGTDDEPRPPAVPLEAEESRRRMLTARRRLLGMLIALEAAAIALAVLGLAALWVVAPPTIMLAGYLLLLREAAQADAEHAQREAEAAAASVARARERAQARRENSRRPVLADTPVEGTPLAARFAAAPVPADYEDSGRDFAPGLAGKYTPSNADSEIADEDPYGYVEPRFRRAVGD